MAIYKPRQSPPKPSKGGRRSKGFGSFFANLFRKKTSASKPLQSQAMVSGVQRAWKWKQLGKNVLLICIVFGISGAALWFMAQLLLQSTIFRLTDIKVNGTRIATQRQILDLAGLQQGGSLLRFDAHAAAMRIETHPWVEQVEIKTQWPSAVEITVSEFQPFALANVEAGKERRLRYLTRSCRLFSETGPGQELDFPVITGVHLEKDVEADRLVPGSLAEAACRLLSLAARGNAILPIQAISEVHANAQLGIILYLVDRPFPIYFGTDQFQTKYNRLIRVMEQLYTKRQVDAVKAIRMDYFDDKVLVTGIQLDG